MSLRRGGGRFRRHLVGGNLVVALDFDEAAIGNMPGCKAPDGGIAA